MNDSTAKIIQRFEEFGKKLCGDAHGWKKKFADALGVAPAQLSSMRSGLVPIGPKMQNKLRELGADVNYILTGVKAETEVHIQFDMPGHLTAEQGEQYQKLMAEMKKISEDDPEAIEKMLILTQTIFKKK
jgi:alkylhydroperoxidase/carboxymuconolactone decarboxylase family protein YurZ